MKVQRTGYALAAVEQAAGRLLAAGRADAACGLVAAAVRRLPGSTVLAKLLEKAASRLAGRGAARKIYAELLSLPGICPVHHYWLGIFCKRDGDYPGMKKAFGDFLRARGELEPQYAYSAACALDRYEEAFLAAERLLDAPPEDAVLSRLWNPWGDRCTVMPRGFLQARLANLEKARVSPELEQYRGFLRGALLHFSGRYAAALRAFGRLPALSPARYGWMRFPAGLAALLSGDLGRAEKEFSVSVKAAVSRATSMGRLAEVYICTGRRAEAFKKIRAAQKLAPLWARSGLLAWEGQLLLFAGRYKEALKPLTLGGEGGDDAAWCWRGAALLKLGRVSEALKDLARAVEVSPTDWEARVWLAEALRAAGRRAEAAAQLEKVLSHAPHNWAHIGRALLRADAGDLKGMKADFMRVSPEMRGFLSGAAGGGIRNMLEKAGELAMGDRRDEEYFRRAWMGRPARRFTSRRSID